MATGVCAWLSLWVGVCAAFNLDTSFPVMKTGGDGSLFGLSVSLHQDLQTDRYLLLVGAPREKAEPHVPANRTGGVYSCPITADQSDCSRMKLIDPDQILDEDLLEDMWLGVTVASQGRPGGRVLACGHRFVKLYGLYKLRHMTGRCYLRGNDLQYNSDDQWQEEDQVCSHLGDVSAEAMCTLGISAHISQTEVIMGSPGSYDWQGNVHVKWINPENNDHSEKSSFKKPQAEHLHHRNIYIGYSVTQARGLLSQENETVVTGAPKDSKADARGSVLLAVNSSRELITLQTLRGEQTGSYFGNAVATTDLNNDGWNDLLVGAPFYFQRQQELGGAVYVYINAGGRFDSESSLVLTGPAGSAFGMSVAAAGDLNQDGFQDFAVGAPFHETGSVMIWTGSSQGVSQKPSQVIKGSRISPGFRTFGYSLFGGVDADGNKYPDLLVGSLDNRVALLRSRPVVHLNKTLRVSPEIVDPNDCDFCIQVQVCFSFMLSTGETSDRENITVSFTVAADVTSHQPRLRFRDNKSVFSGYLSMRRNRCETLRAGLLSSIRDKVEPLEFSLNVSLYQKPPKKRNSLQDLKHFPVLSEIPKPIRTQIHIQKACGSDNRCHSNLQMAAQFKDENQRPLPRQMNAQVLHYNNRISRLFLEVNVSNTPSPGRPAEDAHNANLNVSIPPLLTYSGVRTVGEVQTVVRCSDVNKEIHCELGNPIGSNQKFQVLIIFQPTGISFDTREIQAVLQLSTLSEQSDLSPVSVSMLVEYSLQTSLSLISAPGPTFFGGHVMGESAMKTTEDVGTLVLFELQVHVIGKPLGHLGNLEVEFDWPWEVSNGKWLLYLVEIQVNGTSEGRCGPSDIVNPRNLTLPEEETRTRRSLEEEEKVEERKQRFPPVLNLQGQKKKSYTLDCNDGANCVRFTCPLVNMNNSATLALRARLWNSTMIEDYSDARSVVVRARATLKLHTDKPTISMRPQSAQMEVHVYPELGQKVDSSAPLWIIVVSILAGVLLLALICLLLWKCGFFRRASTRELYQAKTQKAQMKSQPSDSDRLDSEF